MDWAVTTVWHLWQTNITILRCSTNSRQAQNAGEGGAPPPARQNKGAVGSQGVHGMRIEARTDEHASRPSRSVIWLLYHCLQQHPVRARESQASAVESDRRTEQSICRWDSDTSGFMRHARAHRCLPRPSQASRAAAPIRGMHSLNDTRKYILSYFPCEIRDDTTQGK